MTTGKTCSHCGHNGHKAPTCLNGVNKGSVKLFGVNISSDPIRSPEVTALRKSVSLGNLDALLANDNSNGDPIAAVEDNGYHSDGQIHSKTGRSAHEKKKGKFSSFLFNHVKRVNFLIFMKIIKKKMTRFTS